MSDGLTNRLMSSGAPPVVLASGSTIRSEMLARAGVEHMVERPRVDEEEAKASLRAAGAPVDRAAETLAELKAVSVSRRCPDALVIGADQMLASGGGWLDKPADRTAAAAHLRALAGRTHELVTGVVVARSGSRIWHRVERARLTMRPLSDAFIDAYLDAAGEAACRSVGAYQLEALGAQLFTRIDGDFFTILGLPLLPLLDVLRAQRALRQ